MLWALPVLNILLDLDMKRLPFLGLWRLSVLLPRVVFCHFPGFFWPATRTKMNLISTFVALLTNAGHDLRGWDMLHLPHALHELSLVLWPLPLLWLLWPFLYLKVMISSIVDAVKTPPLNLCLLKSFTVISCSLAYLSRAVYVTSYLFFFDQTHVFTSKCFVAWKNNSVLGSSLFASVVYWHLLTRFLIRWFSWSVNSCSPCLMSMYILSMWFQYQVEISKYLLWP